MNRTIAPRLARHWPLALFLFIGTAIVLSILAAIRAPHFEIGDFAANSLLIQDAKHLALLKGNYSRIGVNHPGPAILYVLAAGELVLYDWLHLVRSPLAGQLVAVAFYSACWLVLIARELRRQTGSAAAAAAGTALFALTAALLDHNFFTGLWFPHLYFFPFAAFLVSLCRLADGYADSAMVTAVSAGFAINGHVSFLSTVAVVVVLVVAINAVVFRRADRARRILGRTFFAAHGRRLGNAIAVGLLFLVPLALETVLHFPGPVPGYFAFGQSKGAHPFHDAFAFMVAFWGGVAPFVAAAVGLWLASRPADATAIAGPTAIGSPSRWNWAGSVAIVAFAATVALLVYAVYGIDYLAYTYTAFFYDAVPCLVVATMAACAIRGVDARRRTLVATVISVMCAVGVADKLHGPSAYDEQYHEPGIPALYDAMHAHASSGRLVLDLDDHVEWGWMWLRFVGVKAYAKRRHVDLFCVHRNWHILFTEEARCTEQELRTGPRYIVRVVSPGTMPAPAFEALRFGFFRVDPPNIVGVGRVEVLGHEQLFNDYFDESGFGPTEGTSVWSTDDQARMAFRVGPNFDGTVTLDLGAFLPNEAAKQRFRISSGAGPVQERVFTLKQARQMVEVPVHTDAASDTVDVRIGIPDAQSPAAAHFGDDPRRLGVSVFAVRVDAR